MDSVLTSVSVQLWPHCKHSLGVFSFSQGCVIHCKFSCPEDKQLLFDIHCLMLQVLWGIFNLRVLFLGVFFFFVQCSGTVHLSYRSSWAGWYLFCALPLATILVRLVLCLILSLLELLPGIWSRTPTRENGKVDSSAWDILQTCLNFHLPFIQI